MAETNLRKLMTLIDEGRYLEKKREPKETLGEFSERYLEWCKDVGQKAYDSKEQRINLVAARLGKETLLGKITRADIERYQGERLSTPGQSKAQVKPATVNRELAALKHMFNKAVEWKVVDDNPPGASRCSRKPGGGCVT
jgi:site-specific recombinase XerD